ncbi:MAG: SulP family inorganic anion transporter [Firmicutes bacterium]|nr:SulP family inorganic anion transporter [Bacillota bacterium]
MKHRWKRVRGDVIGGATAALVALPLALAFGIASGAGGVAGLYAAIFGGLTAALFGGCGVQITGPTGAMTAVLVSIVHQHGVSGLFLAGVIARLMHLRCLKRIPESLFGIITGLVINELLIHSPQVVRHLPFGVPQLTLAQMPWANITQLVRPAITICLLGSISALLSAEVTDNMLGTQHNSNRELIGQGLGNIVSSLIGGIPVSVAVARSGVNVYSGGRTRLSSI